MEATTFCVPMMACLLGSFFDNWCINAAASPTTAMSVSPSSLVISGRTLAVCSVLSCGLQLIAYIGYSVIVALTGLYRIQCNSSSNRSPYSIQCNSSSNRSQYRIQCNSSSNRSPYRIQYNSSSNRSPHNSSSNKAPHSLAFNVQ